MCFDALDETDEIDSIKATPFFTYLVYRTFLFEHENITQEPEKYND